MLDARAQTHRLAQQCSCWLGVPRHQVLKRGDEVGENLVGWIG
jgi:hypothetical protein